MMTKQIYTVGWVNRYLKQLFYQDGLLASLSVSGEVSNLKYHSSGHIYFSLKDKTGAISCVMFAGNRRGLAFPMKDGDKVVVSGNIDYYERDGRCQLYAKRITLAGEGALYEEFVKLKKELEEMGLFSSCYKKPIPKYAVRIGVVTAPTGAVIHDIQNVSARRNPYVQLILYPCEVQGVKAAPSICAGIKALDGKVDVIIVGRGGGSLEDLWAFNERSVAEAIFDCETPVISAVGHETDTTIADYVADLRAPTPSAAAELAVFDYAAFEETLESYANSLRRNVDHKLELMHHKMQWTEARLSAYSPAKRLKEERLRTEDLMRQFHRLMNSRIEDARMQAADLEEELRRAMLDTLDMTKQNRREHANELRQAMADKQNETRHRLELMIARMKGINPIERLSQGYSYTENDAGHAVSSIRQVTEGDNLRVYVSDGIIHAKAETKEDFPFRT